MICVACVDRYGWGLLHQVQIFGRLSLEALLNTHSGPVGSTETYIALRLRLNSNYRNASRGKQSEGSVSGDTV